LTVVVVLVAGLLIGAGVAYVNYLNAKKRREAFAAFAAQQGFSYQPENQALAGQWTGTPFQTGDHRRVRNVLSGTHQGRQVVAFDYSYQTHTTNKGRRTTTTHKYGVVVMRLPGALPRLEVTREGLFGGAVANALGFGDLRFESEQFNRSFHVLADDERFGHAVIHPQMMEMLLAQAEVGWRIEGDSLIGWDAGPHSPTEVMNRLQLLQLVTANIPPYVWRDYADVDPRAS
jgi:hypothetical protein